MRWKGGARAVALSCREAGRRAGWRVTQASGEKARAEEGAAVTAPCREAGRAATRAEGAGSGSVAGAERSTAGQRVEGSGSFGSRWEKEEGEN
jgi:hypothetical protein